MSRIERAFGRVQLVLEDLGLGQASEPPGPRDSTEHARSVQVYGLFYRLQNTDGGLLDHQWEDLAEVLEVIGRHVADRTADDILSLNQ